MFLTETQREIYLGKICPYCHGKSKYVTSKEIYGHDKYGHFYLCKKCNAYVGTHKSNPELALGRLANSELRLAKKQAHDSFDRLWKDFSSDRHECYLWLSGQLNIPFNYTHIGMFNVATCKKVKELSDKLIEKLSQIQ